MSSCNEFRAGLSEALSGRPGPTPKDVAWHAHLGTCPHCRALLEAEEALEVLLATLPDPALPTRLAERVLARLEAERTRGLDRLLDLDRASGDGAPEALSDRILAGLSTAREEAAQERRLDQLLGRVEVQAPADLPERVLEGLAAERRGVDARPRWTLLRGAPAWVAAAAAAAILALLGRQVLGPEESEGELRAPDVALVEPQERGSRADELTGVMTRTAPGPGPNATDAEAPIQPQPAPGPEAEIDAELLAALDVLERWDVLIDDDVSVLLASLDPEDAALLDLAFEEEEEG